MMIFCWLPCNTNAMYSLAMWPIQIATVGWYRHCKCTVANTNWESRMGSPTAKCQPSLSAFLKSHLSVNRLSILTPTSRMQLAYAAFHILEDKVETQLASAIRIMDPRKKLQVSSYDAASNNSLALRMPCDVMLPGNVSRNLVNQLRGITRLGL